MRIRYWINDAGEPAVDVYYKGRAISTSRARLLGAIVELLAAEQFKRGDFYLDWSDLLTAAQKGASCKN